MVIAQRRNKRNNPNRGSTSNATDVRSSNKTITLTNATTSQIGPYYQESALLSTYNSTGQSSLGVNVSSTYQLMLLSDITRQNFSSSSNISTPGCSATFNTFSVESSSTQRTSHKNVHINEPIRMPNLDQFEANDAPADDGNVYQGISISYLDHGDKKFMCGMRNALLWEAESKREKTNNGITTYSLCCSYGDAQLPEMKSAPLSYVDNSVNKGNAPYSFRLGGENYHSLGGLLPMSGQNPRFSQLTFTIRRTKYQIDDPFFGKDTESNSEVLDNQIINYLKDMLDSKNPLIDARTYNLPTTFEVAALIVGDIGEAIDKRDIIVTTQSGALQCISELHPCYVPIQYPIFFPYGEDGYRIDIVHRKVRGSTKRKGKKCTMREFFSYRFQDRPHGFSLILNGGRLMQQLFVDAYTMIETQRLHYVRTQQKNLRSETYENLRNVHSAGTSDVSTAGQRIILPSSFTGGTRYMMQNYLDAMTICRWPDRATISLVQDKTDLQGEVVDEVKAFYDCRYLSACEAAWRIFAFDVHYRVPSMIRLPFHFPGQQIVVFADDDDVEDILNKSSVGSLKFIAWMECNQQYGIARTLTYAEFPTNLFGNPMKGFGTYVKGPMCFEDMRTGDGEVYATYRDACYKRGLLDDDNEYIEAIEEASHTVSGYYLRSLFATMLITYSLSRPDDVWEKCWHYLIDGILYKQQNDQKNPDLLLSETQLKNLALLEIENFLLRNNCTLRCFPTMPFPDDDSILASTNRFMNEELAYDTEVMTGEFRLFISLTDEQRDVYNQIMEAVDQKRGDIFVYNYGGTGKTFLWKTLSASIRSKCKIVLNVASSGIASLLLEGGRTAHSKFLIPINLTKDSKCSIKQNPDICNLINKNDLIILDEAPMIHKYDFEALDRTLKGVIKYGNHSNCEHPSGGKVLRLTKNMKLTIRCQSSNLEDTIRFAEWLLELGEGKLGGDNYGNAIIEIPDDLLIRDSNDPLSDLIDFVYPLNISSDSLDNSESVGPGFDAALHSPDFLNGLKISGMPNHRLVLQVGVPIMLLRNIDQKNGLCNGTRLQVISLGRRFIEVKDPHTAAPQQQQEAQEIP
ncbi:uncharacterized protein LOC143622616 [Bidens hawaiensis]|uniref:uncharacterized protein LOC143622616 n=1 Tax=Bidens hawaiensis TaxID=980011 RepID=UPI00404AEBB4